MSTDAHNQTDDGLANGIAIVGMSGRFPGAPDVETFWQNLCAGVDSVTRWGETAAGARAESGQLVQAGGELADVEQFDAAFFGIGRREAETMDPQHRLFLECAWEALESAGVDPARLAGLIGVFGGCGLNSYFLNQLQANAGAIAGVGAFQTVISNEKDSLATQTAYRLDLRGPAVTVQTACSTSLVAVQAACQALWTYQCDVALAGGASIRVPARGGYLYMEGGIQSPDGRCRPFAAEANGTVGGSGAGVVALQRYADAVAAGSRIVAVIRGAAVNNDGADKVGYTAPGLGGQAAAIALALAQAGLEPRDIGFVEAHGTGTALGDPVEVAALTRAFGAAEQPWCALGAVKANIGHLDAAAGVTGLIKAALAVARGQIPPSLGAEKLSPRIDFARSPFFVNATLHAWDGGGRPRRAGVSSFGIGGTNAHVVLEQAPATKTAEQPKPESGVELLVVSAKNAAAATVQTARVDARVGAGGDAAEVAGTLATGRKAFAQRTVRVWPVEKTWAPVEEALENPATVFLLPGQGSVYAGMGRGLYETEPVYRAAIDECAEILGKIGGRDLRDGLNDAAWLATGAGGQPALFAVEWALARQWAAWGVTPRALLGHSLGEYVAATIAGCFSLGDALRLVAARGRIMDGLPAGAMLAVPASAETVAAWLPADLEIATINAPTAMVVSGAVDAVGRFEAALVARGVASRRLAVARAFHSRMMDAAIAPFAAELRKVKFAAPKIPWVSNLTGTWIRPEEARDPGYWTAHLRQPVKFAAGMATLAELGVVVPIEVGPGRTLAGFWRQRAEGAGAAAVQSMRHPQESRDDRAFLLGAAGRAWMRGVALDWTGVQRGEPRRKVELPAYAWQRERFWVERSDAVPALTAAAVATTARGPEDWVYFSSWRKLPASIGQGVRLDAGGRTLVLVDDPALPDALAAAGCDVVRVKPGEDLRAVARSLKAGGAVRRVVHAWCLPEKCPVGAGAGAFADWQAAGFASVVTLVQALAGEDLLDRTEFAIVTSGLANVTGAERLEPAKATLLGLARVLPQEFPGMTVRVVDVAADEPVARIAATVLADEARPLTALRGGAAWAPHHEPVNLATEAKMGVGLREGGVYLITGGLGNIGLTLAEFLAEKCHAKLVLVGRTAPDEAKRARIAAMETRGAQVLAIACDVADAAAVAAAVRAAEARFGALHGVIHGAGATGEAAVQAVLRADSAGWERQFAPKAHGLLALERALVGKRLDFCVLLSSLSTVLGGLGFGAYAAANCFLDACAERQNRDAAFPWLSVAWDGWNFGGATKAEAIGPRDGATLFQRLVERGAAGTWIVATGDLAERKKRWAMPVHSLTLAATTGRMTSVDPADVEGALTEIWKNVLGAKELGRDTNFFEAGGDSLAGVQMISLVNQRFGARIPAAAFFEAPTIRSLARQVQPGAAPAADEINEGRQRGALRRERRRGASGG